MKEQECVQHCITVDSSKEQSGSTTTPKPGLCCQFLRQGKCTAPRPPCRLRHEPDDGTSPCFFGASCRNGHKNRVLGGMSKEERIKYWHEFNAKRGNLIAAYENPAERDGTLLRSQLEPWSTAYLRWRLADAFGEEHVAMDALPRGESMLRLLQHYEKCDRKRKTMRVLGTPVDPTLCDQLLEHLRAWSEKHKVNNRPSINAESYMILRSPLDFNQQQSLKQQQQQSQDTARPATTISRKARVAAKKLQEHRGLWDLAQHTMFTIDPTFAASVSALAVTKNFRGSPHIDKQNSGPFYGLALGNFDDGTGGVCVEVDAFTVAHNNTKNRLAKVDGRYPHWVAPYTYNNHDKAGGCSSEQYRYSLIYYTTGQAYGKPGPAYFGEVVEEEGNANVDAQ
mmetsp:Transcript_6953/g.14788  ORF Transcript_6953/g.14788 Transcript_6953/m.14788 type:complete len:395 (+) Transcript_6953:251-1435(+)